MFVQYSVSKYVVRKYCVMIGDWKGEASRQVGTEKQWDWKGREGRKGELGMLGRQGWTDLGSIYNIITYGDFVL